MSSKYKIPRKIDHQPIIYGLTPNYFYLMFLLGVLFGFAIAIGILKVGASGSTSGIRNLFLVIGLLVFIYGFLYYRFKKKSKFIKYPFKKISSYYSNKNLNDVL